MISGWRYASSVTALERVTAPAAEPISLAEAKAQARVDHADDDTLIGALIDAAVDMVDGDGHLGRAMITQTWAQWAPTAPGVIRLRMGPFQSLTSIQYFDENGTLQSADVADFEVRKFGDLSDVYPKDGKAWPTADARADAIKVTYVAGFGDAASDVPAGIRHALLMLVAHWYDTRKAASEASLHDAPMAVDALLGRHRVGWYG